MAAHIKEQVRKQPVLAFYMLAFAITWLGWLPQAAHAHGLFPFDSPVFYVLGGVGPMLAAYIVLRVLHGENATEELFAPLLRWRVGIGWYAVALGGYAVVWLAALALRGELGTAVDLVTPSLALLATFAIRFVAAIPEEVAWRGFALPRLQARHGALAASLIVGVFWALWHLPLLLIKGDVMSTYPLAPYFLEVIAISVVYTWLYNSTRGSVLIVTIFHAASNVVGPFLGVEQTVAAVLVAAALVILWGPARLARHNAPTPQYQPVRSAGLHR